MLTELGQVLLLHRKRRHEIKSDLLRIIELILVDGNGYEVTILLDDRETTGCEEIWLCTQDEYATSDTSICLKRYCGHTPVVLLLVNRVDTGISAIIYILDDELTTCDYRLPSHRFRTQKKAFLFDNSAPREGSQ